MKKITRVLLITFAMVMLSAMQVMAAGTKSFDASQQQAGDNYALTVTVAPQNIYSGEVTMNYNPEVVDVVEVEAGQTLENVSNYSINNENGVITVGFSNLTEVQAGELLQMEYQVVGTIPADGTLFTIQVKEWSSETVNDAKRALEAKDGEYQLAVNPDGTGITVNYEENEITQPENPVNPVNPENPTVPDESATSGENGNQSGQGNQSGSTSGTIATTSENQVTATTSAEQTSQVDTGDGFSFVPVMIVLAAGGVLCAVAIVTRKKAK